MTPPLYGKCGPDGSASGAFRLVFPEILSDPLVRSMMRADGVDASALESCLARIAEKLALAPRNAAARGFEPC